MCAAIRPYIIPGREGEHKIPYVYIFEKEMETFVLHCR